MDIGHPDKMIESIWIDSNKLQECVVPYSVNHGYSAVAVEVFVITVITVPRYMPPPPWTRRRSAQEDFYNSFKRNYCQLPRVNLSF